LSRETFVREYFLFVENGRERVPSIVTRHLLERSAQGDPHPMVADFVILELEGSHDSGQLLHRPVGNLVIRLGCFSIHAYLNLLATGQILKGYTNDEDKCHKWQNRKRHA
jgi:hypothetical protein